MKLERLILVNWGFVVSRAYPFGDATRRPTDALKVIRGFAKRGVWGFEFHDNDIFPMGASAAQVRKLM
ncbi:MAG: hypothetical protein HGA75_12380, partial [Thiobacillus sp.]|nr:hypothetical protein [Thiobacillus sp.]